MLLTTTLGLEEAKPQPHFGGESPGDWQRKDIKGSS